MYKHSGVRGAATCQHDDVWWTTVEMALTSSPTKRDEFDYFLRDALGGSDQ